jgi:hypothetical protein
LTLQGGYFVKKYKLDGGLLPPMFSDTTLKLDLIVYYDDVSPPEEITNVEIYTSILKGKI